MTTKPMTPAERLKEIREHFPYSENYTEHYKSQLFVDVHWLISRVEKLEKLVLESYREGYEQAQEDFLNEHNPSGFQRSQSKQALEEE